MDPNIFARVVCYEDANSADAFKTSANRHHYVPTTREEPEQNSRESTPHQLLTEDNEESPQIKECLELRFEAESTLKDPSEGWLFGNSPLTSDVTICLPGTRGVSRRHFSISITPDLRIQFHQKSDQRTRVVYHSKTSPSHEIHPQTGDKFFICLAPSEFQYWNNVEVIIGFRSQGVHFYIVFPNHTENATPEYYNYLRQWVQMKASAAPPIASLGLDSAISTIAPSRQSPSPPQFGSLCYQRTIGRGSFGTVELLVDLTTGNRAARKTLLGFDNSNTASEKGRITADFWNEARLIQRNPHPNIVQLLALQHEPYPSIIMPYYPHGNMYDLPLEQSQYRSAFRQLLIVLEYLHDRNVAHRDLKPENFLVQSLSPIHIVVTDFGLSKEAIPGNLMTTFCGTKLYSAPDVFPSRQRQSARGYWVSVDIWSAGIIMLEWTYGRPSTYSNGARSLTEWIEFWSNSVLNAVQKHDRENPGDPVISILKKMLVLEPQKRYQASECLRHGCATGLFKRTRAGDVIDADDEHDDNGSNTPKPQMAQQSGQATADGVVTYKTVSTELATEHTGQTGLESREPPVDRRDSGDREDRKDNPRSRSNSQTSTWERFMAFDPIPTYELASVPKETSGTSHEAEETVPAEEKVSAPRGYLPLREELGESPRYVSEHPQALPLTGLKRPRSKTPSVPLSDTSSKKKSTPPKKKRPTNIGDSSEV